MASPRIPYNRYHWRQLESVIKALQLEISRYVRTYIDAYETLRESFMNRYTNEPLRLLKPGTDAQMEAEVKTLYGRIHANAMRFQEVFLQIKGLLGVLVEEAIPERRRAGHEIALVFARNQGNDCATQIQQLEQEMGALRNEILDRERFYSMMEIYHPPHTYPAHIRNWFKIQDDLSVRHVDWYRTAHRGLLEDFDRAVIIVRTKINHFDKLYIKVLEFSLKHFRRLVDNVPRFNQWLATMRTMNAGVINLNNELNNLRQRRRISGNEGNWRLPTLRLINIVSPLVDRQMKKLRLILAMFIVFREQYIRSSESHLDDIMNEFAAIFMKK